MLFILLSSVFQLTKNPKESIKNLNEFFTDLYVELGDLTHVIPKNLHHFGALYAAPLHPEPRHDDVGEQGGEDLEDEKVDKVGVPGSSYKWGDITYPINDVIFMSNYGYYFIF